MALGTCTVDGDGFFAGIAELGELMTRERFIEGRLTQPDGDGVLVGMLIATSHIQCVLKVS